MQILTLYLSTAVIFLGLDAIMLKTVMRPVFETRIAHLLLDDLRLGPAVVFYLFYVAGVVWFVSLPALRAGAPWQALVQGAVLGAMAYGTYEFTSMSILKNWSWAMVATDTIWGAVLTGFCAWAGVMILMRLQG